MELAGQNDECPLLESSTSFNEEEQGENGDEISIQSRLTSFKEAIQCLEDVSPFWIPKVVQKKLVNHTNFLILFKCFIVLLKRKGKCALLITLQILLTHKIIILCMCFNDIH